MRAGPALWPTCELPRNPARRRSWIVVDPLEELLVPVPSSQTSALLRLLTHAFDAQGVPLFVLATLRSDFLDVFQNHAALGGVAFASIPVGPMPVGHFPQLIEGPAARAALDLEPGLVQEMVHDAETDDALPLLAFTLRELYERCKSSGRLTLNVYRDDLGGLQGSVARVVEGIKKLMKPTEPVLKRAACARS